MLAYDLVFHTVWAMVRYAPVNVHVHQAVLLHIFKMLTFTETRAMSLSCAYMHRVTQVPLIHFMFAACCVSLQAAQLPALCVRFLIVP